MGETMMGAPAQQVGSVELLDPAQKKFLRGSINNVNMKKMGKSVNNLLSPYSEDMFQSSVVDPAMQTYEQQILPSIQQRFVDSNSAASSALNQTLAQSAGDLSNVLASQRLDLQKATSGQNLGVLSILMQLLNPKTTDAIVQGPTSGILKDLISAGGNAAAAYASSSKEVKENIVDYNKGLETLNELKVKQYDYTIPVTGSQKERVGLIAEDVPSEFVSEIDGVKSVDIYGLVSLLINSVKQLDEKVKHLEGRGE